MINCNRKFIKISVLFKHFNSYKSSQNISYFGFMNISSIYILILFFFPSSIYAQTNGVNELIICGDTAVYIIDYDKTKDSIPYITWQWSAMNSELPEDFKENMRSTDECKPVNNGSQILNTSSGGGVVLVDRKSKEAIFYAHVVNAHSAELLPNNRIVVAGSTGESGNCLNIYDLNESGSIVYSDSLYSAHGVVWDEENEILYALGYDELRKYNLQNWESSSPSIELIKTIKIPGISGHDLNTTPDKDQLILTETNSVWIFNKKEDSFEEYKPMAGYDHVKSVDFHPQSNQLVYIKAEEEWWSNNIYFKDPSKRIYIGDTRIYKVRWNYR